VRLEKYQGAGNDFLVLVDAAGSQPVDAAFARAVCHRHTGVGADGLIRVTGELVMELWNADGSRAELSGNGLRCVARAVVDAGVSAGPEVVVQTDVGPRRVMLDGDGEASVEMGRPTVKLESDTSAVVDLGNPHLVVLVPSPPDTSPVDDPSVNVEAVVVDGNDELTLRVWERGVGETLACGTGACAAVAAAHEWGLVGTRATVHQRGGDVTVELRPDNAILTGPVVHVATVEVPNR
jgi:diaminopimelate epimerase